MISRPRRRSWHNYPDDQGQVIAEFFDVNGTLLGTIATPLQHVGTSGWVEGTTSGAVPPGARQVRIAARRTGGPQPSIMSDGSQSTSSGNSVRRPRHISIRKKNGATPSTTSPSGFCEIP